MVSREFVGDRKDRWEKSKGASKTEVSGQLVQIMEGQSQSNIRASEDRLLWQHMVAYVVNNEMATWHDMTVYWLNMKTFVFC